MPIARLRMIFSCSCRQETDAAEKSYCCMYLDYSYFHTQTSLHPGMNCNGCLSSLVMETSMPAVVSKSAVISRWSLNARIGRYPHSLFVWPPVHSLQRVRHFNMRW